MFTDVTTKYPPPSFTLWFYPGHLKPSMSDMMCMCTFLHPPIWSFFAVSVRSISVIHSLNLDKWESFLILFTFAFVKCRHYPHQPWPAVSLALKYYITVTFLIFTHLFMLPMLSSVLAQQWLSKYDSSHSTPLFKLHSVFLFPLVQIPRS